ncbi:RlmE family RNA methyltransferase [Candidatus Spongiihabitans sp.]|uniref:RlmE family RNA methyltransferase n=1 Tax=Candidatus Spongiihabitans sp. TaxID=3101308 RepID=UPI003C7EBD53
MPSSRPHTSHKTSGNKKSQWAAKQNRDPFVRQARSQGLRARSVFKLEQIDRKHHLIKPNSKIVDLGSAPGSWSQYAASKVVGSNQIVGVDLLPMKEIAKVRFIQGDFCDRDTQRRAMDHFGDCFGDSKIDLVLSDMAPNITGIRSTDQANAAQLQDAILAFCRHALKARGRVLTKLFEGESVGFVRTRFIEHFDQVQMVKPDASRAESREVYLLARGFKLDSSRPDSSRPD